MGIPTSPKKTGDVGHQRSGFAIRRGDSTGAEYRPERRARRVISWEEPEFLAGYNPEKPMATLQRVSYVLIVVCLTAVCALGAEKWDAPAAEASRRIIALAGNGPLSFEVRNASSVPQDQVAVIRRAIDSNLRSQGVQMREAAQGFATVRVTLSENVQGWVWIIELPASDGKFSIMTVPRETNALSPNGTMTLRRSLLFSGREEILDAAPLSKNGEHVVVLTPSNILVYRSDAGTRTWNLENSWGIPHANYPRDLRGRLQMDSDGEFTAFLPGIRCSGKALQRDGTQCANSDDPWWLTGSMTAFFNSARNHFTGVVPGLSRTLPAFYSAAALPRKGESWLVSTVEGSIAIVEGANVRPAQGTKDWGSDFASVHSGCGNGTQIVTTSAGDNASDNLRAFEIPESTAVSVSAPLVFEGTISALWTKPAGDSAVAIVKTPTGTYEAYSVSITCNQ